MSKFKLGDRVKIVVRTYVGDPGYDYGSIVEISEVTNSGYMAGPIGHNWSNIHSSNNGSFYYGEFDLEAIEVSNDYDKAIADMKEQLAILEDKRAESLKPKIPGDIYDPGTIVKVHPFVPFVKLDDGKWMSSINPSVHWDWAELFDGSGSGSGKDVDVLYRA